MVFQHIDQFAGGGFVDARLVAGVDVAQMFQNDLGGLPGAQRRRTQHPRRTRLIGQEGSSGFGLGATGFRQRAAGVILIGLGCQRMGMTQQQQFAEPAHGRTSPMGMTGTLLRFHVPCKGWGSVIVVLIRPLAAPSQSSTALPADCLRAFQSG